MGTIATIVGLANALFVLAKNLLGLGGGKPADENTQAVETANKVAQTTGTATRTAEAAIDKGEQDASNSTDAAVAAVRAAGSLSDGNADVQAAITRANSHAGSGG